jgi:hypothetical protein
VKREATHVKEHREHRLPRALAAAQHAAKDAVLACGSEQATYLEVQVHLLLG